MPRAALSMLVFLMLSGSAAVWAAGQMKPGLWEMTIKSDAMKNRPKIPPEQLEKMRQMGINMPQMQDGAMVTKVCISKEMAAREEPPPMHRGETGCETKNYRRTANGFSLEIVCDGARLKGQGSATGTFSGPERLSSTYDFTGTSQGRPITQHQESTGRWLAADCGDVQPAENLMKRK